MLNNETGEDGSVIEFYAKSHIKENGESIDEEAEKNYARMLEMKKVAIEIGEVITHEKEEEIMLEVLGNKCSFLNGPNKDMPTLSIRATQKDVDAANARADKAETNMDEMRQEVQGMREDMQQQIQEKVKEAMLAFIANIGQPSLAPQN
ncbi:uncharacterized protein LOC132310118 [Cornus florida]|uniref:uncharacterized protein LOC132310118 n=1 Tax=Cornus florida TaxID=4283 RepID=UPI00289BA412|nr:uncharacterized protein LOC132310118 [Cornus florida]